MESTEHRKQDSLTKGNCCFNHVLGLPRNNNDPDKEIHYLIINKQYMIVLQNHRHLWILKSTGLGISEFFLKIYGMVMFER